MSDAGYRERWMKQIGTILTAREGESQGAGFSGPKEFLGALASWAGKGRDELLQVICREIGQATAAVLKEPLAELMRHRKLQITIELMHTDEVKNKEEDQEKRPPKASKSRSAGKAKSANASRKTASKVHP